MSQTLRVSMFVGQVLATFSLPTIAFAQIGVVKIDTGVTTTVERIFEGLINIMIVWGPILAASLFICGAFWMVLSGGEETRLASGKKMMKGAAIGLAILLASWLILNTIVTFLFSSI